MRELVLDIETQREFAEVGGRNNFAALGVSLVGVYDYEADAFLSFRESELPQLEELVKRAERVVGFNILGFDWPVLQPYLGIDLAVVPTLDLMADVAGQLGFRVGLESLAQSNLGEGKSGKGLEAIQWYRAGKWDKLIKYCLDDVRLTRDLYEYGKAHGKLEVSTRQGPVSVSVPWGREETYIALVLRQAYAAGRQVEIEYLANDNGIAGTRTTRIIEVRGLVPDRVEAYCHLRKDMRHFVVSKILRAKMLDAAPAIQSLF